MKIQAILFDLDGTLVDTEPAAAIAMKSCFSRWNIQLSHEDATYITGRTWASAFDYLFKKYTLPVSFEQASQEMMAAYRAAVQTELLLVPGGAQAVTALAAKWPLALVSGSNRQEIFYALDRLQVKNHFRFVLGAEDYQHGKPSPEGFLKAMQMLGVRPENVLIFEDSHAGIAAARAAGAWVIAISCTNHFQQDTSAAHHHIPDLSAVNVEWVEKWCVAMRLNSRES